MRKPNCYSDNCMAIQDPWTPFLLVSCLKVLVLVALWRNLHTDCGAGGFWLPAIRYVSFTLTQCCLPCRGVLQVFLNPHRALWYSQNSKILSLKQKYPLYSMLWLITHFIFQSHFACFSSANTSLHKGIGRLFSYVMNSQPFLNVWPSPGLAIIWGVDGFVYKPAHTHVHASKAHAGWAPG